MFLSHYAKQLLNGENYQELRWLPLDKLLDQESLSKVKDGRIHFQPDSPSLLASGPRVAEDMISLETLKDPVAISSGHIISRKEANILLSNANPRCPLTNEVLSPNRIVSLPEVSFAIALWKLARKEHQLNLVNSQSSLTVLVGNDKIRLRMSGATAPFSDLMGYIFEGKNNNIGAIVSRSYTALPWSFVWRADADPSQVEMWFKPGSLSNDEVNDLLNEVLKPFNLPQENSAEQRCISMNQIKCREYVTAAEPPGADYLKIGECCVAFIRAASKLREKHNSLETVFTDQVHGSGKSARESISLGTGGIGFALQFSALQSGRSSASMPTQSGTQLFSQPSGHRR